MSLNGDGLDWQDTGNGMLLPSPERVRELENRLMQDGPRCPAARLGRFADTSRAYVACGVEKKAFAVADSPVTAIKWCCGAYDGEGNPLGPCPVWTARDSEELMQQHAATEKARQDAITADQIAKGVRVDDRAHDPELPAGVREVVEETQATLEDQETK